MKHGLMNFPSLLGRDMPTAVKETQHSSRREQPGEKAVGRSLIEQLIPNPKTWALTHSSEELCLSYALVSTAMSVSAERQVISVIYYNDHRIRRPEK